MIPLHLGQLHAYEQLLVGIIAFGPFVVLGFVVHRVRKRDLAAEGAAGAETGAEEAVRRDGLTSGPATPGRPGPP